MFKQTEIAVVTDSTLVVNQVKGIAMCKNVRLVELIKIVSDLFILKLNLGSFSGFQIHINGLGLHTSREEHNS